MKMTTKARAARSAVLFLAVSAAFGALAPAFAQGPAGTGGEPEFTIEADLAYEYRVRSEEILVEPYQLKSGIDLTREYLDRLPLGRLLLGYGSPRGLDVAIEATIRREWKGDWFKADNLPMNYPGNPFAIENLFITRGVASWRSESLDIHFGRDSVDYGKGLKGGLLPSARLPYLDALRMAGRLGTFKADLMIATIPARRAWETGPKYGDDPSYDVDPNQDIVPATDEEAYPYGFEDDINPTTIVEALHRFEWNIGTLSIGLTEQVMMARRNNRFYLIDFFPIISWHQTGIFQTNNSMLVDLAWLPIPGLKVLAQAGFDDINASFAGIGDTGAPTIDAYVIGAEYAGRIGKLKFDAYAEAGYTHWLWGNYDGSSNLPNDQNPLMRFQYRLIMDAGGGLLPLSSPYGPGASWFTAEAGVEPGVPGLRVGLEVLVLSKNPEANLIDTEYAGTAIAAVTDSFLYVDLALPVSWSFRDFSLGFAPSLLVREGQAWFQADIAFRYRYKNR